MRVWLYIHIYPFKTLPFAISRVENVTLGCHWRIQITQWRIRRRCYVNLTAAPTTKKAVIREVINSQISSLDEIVEQGIGGFGWAQFVQAILVSLASLFDSQQ